MKDDVSNIPAGGCNYFNGTTITHYRNNQNREIYAQSGGKWYLISSEYNQYGYQWPSVCFDVNNLNSNAAFLPIFEFIALGLAVLSFGFAFFLFSKLFKGVRL